MLEEIKMMKLIIVSIILRELSNNKESIERTLKSNMDTKPTATVELLQQTFRYVMLAIFIKINKLSRY